MLTQFEHFALAEMLGQTDNPPRANGSLCFGSEWERSVFGMALALAKDGYFEWDDFRDELIGAIKNWEQTHGTEDGSWNYYEQWLTALERTIIKAGIAKPNELV
jgi:nitrile hydratase accessory protein